MSKDSSATYIHMHSPHLADHFEDFCHPPSTTTTTSTNSSSLPSNNAHNPLSSSTTNPQGGPGGNNNNSVSTNGNNNGNDNMAQLPGHFLPFEEIYLPSHLMPVNPEDEDDVVPDMHAAFGINRALGQGQEGVGSGGGGGPAQMREPAWRDFGLEELVSRGPSAAVGASGGGETARGALGPGRNRKDGKRSGLMMMR